MSAAVLSREAVLPLVRDASIDCFGIIPLSDCRITREYLLRREGLSCESGSVLMMALPYRAAGEEPNISHYAVPPDYHLLITQLLSGMIARLKERFPGANFAGYTDHSPIDERHAAACAGLGVIGDHGLLITERYASYVFLCEIISDLPTDALATAPRTCSHCGACRAACPVGLDKTKCLSALTQKKGVLTPDEQETLRCHRLIWGCDRCQEACPYTRRALNEGNLSVPHPIFLHDRIASLTAKKIESMEDAEFACRAYAWRGRETVLRNLRLLAPNGGGEY